MSVSPDSRSVQPHLAQRLGAALTRRRLGGRRTRTLRRLVALALVVTAAVVALAPRSTPGIAVVTAARDLAAGTTLTNADTTVRHVSSAPDGVIKAAGRGHLIGTIVAGPVRRGEILTDARLLRGHGPDPGPGRAAVPISIADAALAALLSPGMHIVLVGLDTAGPEGESAAAARVLADDAVVLQAADPPAGGWGGRAGAVFIVAVPKPAADAVTAAASVDAVTVRFVS